MSNLAHADLCPVVIGRIGTRSDAIKAVVPIIAGIDGIAAIEVGIIFGCHITTTAPRLVAYAKVLHLPSLVTAILATQLGHRRIGVGGHVLHPFCHLFNRTGTYVARNVRLTAKHLAEVQEFVGAKGIVFHGATPVVVDQTWTILLWANAVHPVIFVGKASSWPAHHGNFKGFQGLKHVLAITLNVGDVRIGSYPDAAIDAASEVFGKLSVNLFRNHILGLIGMDIELDILCQYRNRQHKSNCHRHEKFLHGVMNIKSVSIGLVLH